MVPLWLGCPGPFAPGGSCEEGMYWVRLVWERRLLGEIQTGKPCLPDLLAVSSFNSKLPNSRSGLSSCLLLANLALILGPLHLCTWLGVKSGLTWPLGQLHLSVSPTAAKKTAVPVCGGGGAFRRGRDFLCGLSGVQWCLQAPERATGRPCVCQPGSVPRPPQSEQHWAAA